LSSRLLLGSVTTTWILRWYRPFFRWCSAGFWCFWPASRSARRDDTTEQYPTFATMVAATVQPKGLALQAKNGERRNWCVSPKHAVATARHHQWMRLFRRTTRRRLRRSAIVNRSLRSNSPVEEDIAFGWTVAATGHQSAIGYSRSALSAIRTTHAFFS
jgi:hypothetical protein